MIRRVVSIVFYAAFAVFAVWYLQRLDFTALQGMTPAADKAIVATLVALGSRYWGVFVWLTILEQLGARIGQRWKDFAAVYAKSWLGRYLPGKVAWIAGKVYFASAHGISKRKLAIGSLVEAGAQTLVALALSLLLLTVTPQSARIPTALRLAALLAALSVLLVLTPPVFNWVVGWAYRAVRRQSLLEDRVDAKLLGSAIGLYVVGFLLSGLSYFFLTWTFDHGLSVAHLFFVVAVFNLAGAVGVLSVFAPSGLGVRESVQLLLLPLIMSAELALAITVAARVWSMGVDMLFYVLATGTRALRRDSGSSEPS